MIKNYSFYNFIFFKKGEVKMKNKFMRSVTAMVVAVTMLISSQGVVTSFADGEDYSDKSKSSSVQMKIWTCPNLHLYR